jgi:DNA helicase HerA-like ATPase
MLAYRKIRAKTSGRAGFMADHRTSGLGFVLSVTGSRAEVRLYAGDATANHDESRVTIGKLIAVRTPKSAVVGVVARLSGPESVSGEYRPSDLSAEVDFLGEIVGHGTPEAYFQRGVSEYPAVGDKVMALDTEDISVIHHIAGGETINVGQLKLDAKVPAYINFDELLQKHFAVLGTTGVGKSSAVALILREILEKKANLRIFLIDPHNEYGHCFGDMANVISPKNLKLPFWLFDFEEIVDVFFRARPGVEEETEILSELIPIAKARYAAGQRGERVLLRKAAGAGYTPDTPVPYRISDLVDLINERMGKLENRSSWMKYHRLITRIETLGQDSRYAFMFDSLMVEDMMSKVLADLFRLPIGKEPITVMQLAGFPAEVVDSVVSVLCRLAFEFGVWCDGSVPILVACEEAHRYAPADRKLGFGPTRKALSRIAKEGRKYSVFLGVITQRPADLDATILSQCSTVFAMRMANERDQAIVKSAVPDAGSSLIGFLASLGIREAIAFGEGVALPTRLRFADLAREFLPRSQHEGHERFEAADAVDEDFVDAIVDRWREASTTSVRARPAASMPDMVDLDHGLGSLETFAAAPAKQQR